MRVVGSGNWRSLPNISCKLLYFRVFRCAGVTFVCARVARGSQVPVVVVQGEGKFRVREGATIIRVVEVSVLPYERSQTRHGELGTPRGWVGWLRRAFPCFETTPAFVCVIQVVDMNFSNLFVVLVRSVGEW